MSLCKSCKWVRRIKSRHEEYFGCSILDFVVKQPVEECSEYFKKGGTDLDSMKEIALYIEPLKGQAGFSFVKEKDRSYFSKPII